MRTRSKRPKPNSNCSTKFPTTYVDPPWPESGGGKVKRGADRHYKLIPVKRIPEVILNSGVYNPADDSHLYMWTTANYLMDAGWVMEQIGFRYVTVVPWIKPGFGLGQYFRQCAEYLLFGVRGRGFEVRTLRRDIRGLIDAPRGAHSVKPPEVYDLIEARSQGPYLEMFSRLDEPLDGWTHWGDEFG